MYTIGQISEMFSLPISTLRYYDRQGLFPDIKRTGGVRQFGDREVATLRIIECLKKSGLELKDIKQYILWNMEGDSTIPQRKALIEQQRQIVMAEMQKLKDTLDVLNYKQWYYDIAQKAGTCAAAAKLSAEELPEEHLRAKALLKGQR